MSKYLDALNSLEDIINSLECDLRAPNELYVPDYGEKKYIDKVYKALSALDIIKKYISIEYSYVNDDYCLVFEAEYGRVARKISKEEAALLKEVLLHDEKV